jgi:hypothetical protein
VSIDLDALAGRDGLAVGDRVRIGGSGAHAGEVGVIERILRSAIPSAIIRTASGQCRARTIDLTPVTEGSPAAAEGSTVSAGSPEPTPEEEGSPA